MASQLPHEVGAKEPKRPGTKNDQSASPRKEKSVYVVTGEGSGSVGLGQKLVQALSSKMEDGEVDWGKVLEILRESPNGITVEEIGFKCCVADVMYRRSPNSDDHDDNLFITEESKGTGFELPLQTTRGDIVYGTLKNGWIETLDSMFLPMKEKGITKFVSVAANAVDFIQYFNPPRMIVNFYLAAKLKATLSFKNFTEEVGKEVAVVLAQTMPDSEADVGLVVNDNFWKDREDCTPLMFAVVSGFTDAVNTLLACSSMNETELNYGDKEGFTALHMASILGQTNIAKLLLALTSINVNCVDGEYGYTPLAAATCLGHIDIVRLLLAHPSINVNKANNSGVRPLAFAEEHQTATLLTEAGADPLTGIEKIYKKYFKTGTDPFPLYYACEVGKLEDVKFLLQNDRCFINRANDDACGMTPLIIASKMGHADVIKLLLTNSAINVNKEDNDNNKPLEVAKNSEIAKMLKEAGATVKSECRNVFLKYKDSEDPDFPLHVAAFSGNINDVKVLLKNDINSMNCKLNSKSHGTTPLYLAAYKGHTDVVQYLLAQPYINIDDPNQYGVRPLVAADNFEIIKLLREAGATPLTVKEIYGKYSPKENPNKANFPLYYACKRGDIEDVRVLLDNGYNAHIDRTNEKENNWTPLMCAANPETAATLIEYGATPLTVKQIYLKYNHSRCLFGAVCDGRADLVKELLAKDASCDVNEEVGSGFLTYTPLKKASIDNQIEIVKLLLAHPSIDVNKETEDRESSLYAAVRSNNTCVVKLLLEHPFIRTHKKYNNKTAFDVAVQEGYTEIVILLASHIENDCNEISVMHHKIPLHYLCEATFDENVPPSEEIQIEHFQAVKLLHSRTAPSYLDQHGRDRDKIVRFDCSWPKVVEWAKSIGTKYNRYKLDEPVRPIYRSKTCEVYYATDVLADNAPVCLKIIRDRINFESERRSREIKFDEAYVVEVLRYIEDIATREFRTSGTKIGAPSWETDPTVDEFALVMPCANKNLCEAIMSERFAGHDLTTVEYISNSVAKALKHMHDQGLVHGDVKPRNVVRDASGKWKLIDLDAAAKLSEPIGRKYSSAFSPPELAKLLFSSTGESIKELYTTLKRSEGSPPSAAPNALPPPRELIKATTAFDVWGFGCVFYNLCAGRALFSEIDSSDDNIFEPSVAKELMGWNGIDNKRLSFVFQNDKGVSEGDKLLAKDLIRKCLLGDSTKRLQTMDEVLNHPFFNHANRDELTRQKSESGTRGGGKKVKQIEELNSDEFYPDGSYAVIIAIDDYGNPPPYETDGVPNEGFKNLRCAVADATMMRKTLESRGFTVLEELLNENATMTNVKKLMSSVKKTLKGKSRARFVFFLASHGYLEDDEAWMCCHGADMEELEGTCIELKSLKSLSSRLDCSHQLFVLDCCHAGGLFAGTRGKPTKYEQALMGSPAVYGMTAVTEAQEALEDNGHGIFTQAVVDALNGNAFSPEDLYITANQLFAYASRSVFEAADKKQHKQTPKFEPLLQMHKKKSCDGQFLFFKQN